MILGILAGADALYGGLLGWAWDVLVELVGLRRKSFSLMMAASLMAR
jgi:hypothetical protein